MICPTLQDLPPAPDGKTGWPWTEATPPGPAEMPGGKAWPKVSVVTPSFNQGQFLEETIRSVLLQGYPDLEYLIIDGGSTDDSVEVISKYKAWLAYWVSEKDHGQTHAINKGWRLSSGAFLAWLNSDDFLLPGSLAGAVVAMEDERCDLAFADAYIVDEKSRKRPAIYPAAQPQLTDMLSTWNCPVPQQGFVMRREILERCGYLDESLYFAMDFEFWVRCLLNDQKFVCRHTPSAAFRVYRTNKTMSQHSRYVEDVCTILTQVRSRSRDPEIVAICTRSLLRSYANAAHNADAWGLKKLVWRYVFRDIARRGWAAVADDLSLMLFNLLPGRAPWVRFLYYGIERRVRSLFKPTKARHLSQC